MIDALADTSVFVARETGRPVAALPGLVGVSVVTLAELEYGVLRARTHAERAIRLATLAQVRSEFQGLPIDQAVASRFAAILASIRERGLRFRVNDTWIGATAAVQGVPVYTQDDDFARMPGVEAVAV